LLIASDPSAYYSQYYWWEIIAYNIDITGQANLGRNMRYYWVGPAYIIYDIGGSAQLDPHIICAILLGGPTTYNIRYYWVSPPPPYYICDITGWACHI
jgi:hypothetical protein